MRRLVWHAETELPGGTGAVVLPGGFSYGDYLRCGAIGRFAPVMEDVRRFAADGGPVLGICNGFQILCEAGLLPGVLRPNRQLEFVCEDVTVRVESSENVFTRSCSLGEELVIPVKHGEGNWYARGRDARGAGSGRARRPPLRRGRERLGRRRGRRRERGRQRSGPDAAPRARGRSAARPGRRAPDPPRPHRGGAGSIVRDCLSSTA